MPRERRCRAAVHAGVHLRRGGWGLTLLELLLALAIVGVLVSLAYPSYEEYVRRSRNAVAMSDIRRLELRIENYYDANSRLPVDLDEIGGGGDDPWGNPYVYLDIGTVRGRGKVRKDRNLVPLNTDYDLYSKGADGLSRPPLTARASRDDIVRAGNGRFVGLASDY